MNARKGQVLTALGPGLVALLGVVAVLGAAGAGAPGRSGSAVLHGFTATAGNGDGTDADCDWHGPCQSGGGMYTTRAARRWWT